jgi:predicted MFS family arabinose efflux permease
MAAATSVTTTTRDRNAGQGRRRSSLIETVQEKLHSHFMSTLALCGSAFAMFYLLFSVFPYSGFMVMHLVPGVDSENAGIYAGFLSSSFMVGRAFSAYPWGKIADIYGRKFVLVVSLIVSAIGAIAFGCSTSFTMAVVVRFFMGKNKERRLDDLRPFELTIQVSHCCFDCFFTRIGKWNHDCLSDSYFRTCQGR